MSTNIIGFYLIYLKKICANQESYLFVRDYSTKKMIKNIELISHGFKIINLMNYILESQETFNKMGRYYIDHHEIFNMFIILLYDLDYFNLYIKKTVKKMVTFKEEKKKSL